MIFRSVCKRKGRGKVHATAESDWRKAVCGATVDGYVIADEVPTCRHCLRVLLEIETNGN